jgi:hypothetical protein
MPFSFLAFPATLLATAACSSGPVVSTEHVGSTSSALTSTPPPSWTTALSPEAPGQNRPVVAAGRNFILTTSTGSYAYYPRRTDTNGSYDASKPIFTPGGSGDLAHDIFGSQLSQIDAYIATINANTTLTAGMAASDLVPSCATYPSSCNTGTYDNDTVYDEFSGHFFLMAKAGRRNIGLCTPTTGGNGWQGPEKVCHPANDAYLQAMLPRYIMLAVSQCASVNGGNNNGGDCEDPAQGFRSYTLAAEYGDWSQVMVSRGLVMLNYRTASNPTPLNATLTQGQIWVFSANALIAGSVSPTFLPNAGAPTFVASDFSSTGRDANNNVVTTTDPLQLVFFTKQHAPSSSDFPMLVTQHGNQVWAYNVLPTASNYITAAESSPASPALWDLGPWAGSLKLSTPGVVTGPSDITIQAYAHPVWSAASNTEGWPGSLYWAFTTSNTPKTKSSIRAFRWPMKSASPSGSPAYPAISAASAQGSQEWDEGFDDSASLWFPLLEHEETSGDTVLSYLRVWSGSAPNPAPACTNNGWWFIEPHYAAAGPNDVGFSPPVQITDAGAVSNDFPRNGVPDILSNVSDPLHPQIFTTTLSSNGGGCLSTVTDAGPLPDFGRQVTAAAMPDRAPGAWRYTASPSALSIAAGSTAVTSIAFMPVGTDPTGIPQVTPACTIGGAVGDVPDFVDATSDSVSVGWIVPPQTPAGTYVENISCTNGARADVTVTVTGAAPALVLTPSTVDVTAGGSCVDFTADTVAGNGPGAVYSITSPPTGSDVTVTQYYTNGYEGYFEVCATAAAPGQTFQLVVSSGGDCEGSPAGCDSAIVTITVTACTPQTENAACEIGVTGIYQSCGGLVVSDECVSTYTCNAPCPSGSTCSENICCPNNYVVTNGSCCPPGEIWYEGVGCHVTCISGETPCPILSNECATSLVCAKASNGPEPPNCAKLHTCS